MSAADLTGVLAGEPYGFHPAEPPEGPPHEVPQRSAAAIVARLAMAAYMRQLHAEATEPEILMNRAVSHADWMTTASARAGDVRLADAYADVTAALSASRERMYARRGPAVLEPLSDDTTPSLVELDRREAVQAVLQTALDWADAWGDALLDTSYMSAQEIALLTAARGFRAAVSS